MCRGTCRELLLHGTSGAVQITVLSGCMTGLYRATTLPSTSSLSSGIFTACTVIRRTAWEEIEVDSSSSSFPTWHSTAFLLSNNTVRSSCFILVDPHAEGSSPPPPFKLSHKEGGDAGHHPLVVCQYSALDILNLAYFNFAFKFTRLQRALESRFYAFPQSRDGNACLSAFP